MTRQDIVERYCLLASEVWNATVDPIHPNDCFCQSGGFWGRGTYGESDFRNDGQALDFIERAVRAELKRIDDEKTASREGDEWHKPTLTGTDQT